ncbi:MAG: hypothetical protein ABL962_22215, partial [Fimbriimonadaceae bacterium]
EYSTPAITSLQGEYTATQKELTALMLNAVAAGHAVSDARAKEYMHHGVGRRLKVLRRCMENVFTLFPLTQKKPIASDSLDEVQISLHAFVLNLYGLFENLAWAFVHRHNLESTIGDRKRIGLFLESTQKYLPEELRAYLSSPTMTSWHKDYLKNYRDALAHRIPLYIPPSRMTTAESERFTALEEEKLQCIRLQKWDRLDVVYEEQGAIGTACPMFLHSYSDDFSSRPVYLHPQMLCDIKTVLEFGPLFLKHWHTHV